MRRYIVIGLFVVLAGGGESTFSQPPKVWVLPAKKPEIPTTESLRLHGIQWENMIGLTGGEYEEVKRRYRAIQQEDVKGLTPEEKTKYWNQKREAEKAKRRQDTLSAIEFVESSISKGGLFGDELAKAKLNLESLLREKLDSDAPESDEYQQTEQRVVALMRERLPDAALKNEEHKLARDRESRALRSLYDTLSFSVSDNPSTASTRCDNLLETLDSLPAAQANTLLITATVYGLRGNAVKAVALLNAAVAKHGDEPTPGESMTPLRVSCRFWIASVEKHAGHASEAASAYEDLLRSAREDKGRPYDWLLPTLYLGEIRATTLKDERKALELFDSIKNMPSPADPQHAEFARLYVDWADHLGDRIRTKGNTARSVSPDKCSAALLTAVSLAIKVGLVNDPSGGTLYQDERRALLDAQLGKYVKDGTSEIDREMIQLYYGAEYSRYNYGTPSKEKDAIAEKQLSDLFNSDSFWAPVAGMTLAYGQAVRGKTAESDATYEQVKQRFPEYESLIAQHKQSLAQQPPRKR